MSVESAFANFPILTTPRLRLRAIQDDDAEALFATFSDAETMKFYGHGPQQSRSDTEAWIALTQQRHSTRAGIRWAITLPPEDRVIGSCSFHDFDENFHRVETGYVLNRAYWRQGIMAEAMRAVLHFGFTDLELHRIEAIIDIANEGSKNLLLQLGFTYEGNLRQRYFMDGVFSDEHYFGLLRAEWSAAADRA